MRCVFKIVSPLLGMRIDCLGFEHRHDGMTVHSENTWIEQPADAFGRFQNVFFRLEVSG